MSVCENTAQSDNKMGLWQNTGVCLSVGPSVRPSTCNNSVTAGWIFVKYNKAHALLMVDN